MYDYSGEEDRQKTIKSVFFAKQDNQIKQDNHEDIDKNVIQALKKLDTSYNIDYLRYINDEFNNMMLEYMSQERYLVQQ